MRKSVNRLAMKLKRIKKPCRQPRQESRRTGPCRDRLSSATLKEKCGRADSDEQRQYVAEELGLRVSLRLPPADRQR